ncbi:unnamed protein product, partial [Durusdinium trenchii]
HVQQGTRLARGRGPGRVAVLPYDADLDRIMRQKAATPVREELEPQELEAEMKDMAKPNAVVGERTSVGMADVNAQHVSALQATAAQKLGASGEHAAEFVLRTGNKLLDQFRPQYFGFAFPYIFKYCTGMPDPAAWSNVARYRREKDAPRMELHEWVRVMARRCESQIGRDWVFGFAAWNLHFRSALNLCRSLAVFEGPVMEDETGKMRRLTPKDIEDGALQLLRSLQGCYISKGGKPKPVNGDVSKLPYVRGLGPAARKLAQSMRHTAQSMPGTQEARKRMRFEIEALRIRYGTPIFVTFSPDEAHQLLYVRLSRARWSDPVRAASMCQNWDVSARDYPPLDENYTWPIHKLQELREAYLLYSGHVMHGVYEGLSQGEIKEGIRAAEASWPEHKEEQIMIACPAYQRRRASATEADEREEAMAWAREYLAENVATLQFLKQHHCHPLNAETGERVPLHGCQKADKPGACKSEFPRTAWLSDKGEVLCPCKAEGFGMSTQGRKNRLGALHGPYGNEWLNCCHPALLAALRGVNVDVQLPYR